MKRVLFIAMFVTVGCSTNQRSLRAEKPEIDYLDEEIDGHLEDLDNLVEDVNRPKPEPRVVNLRNRTRRTVRRSTRRSTRTRTTRAAAKRPKRPARVLPCYLTLPPRIRESETVKIRNGMGSPLGIRLMGKSLMVGRPVDAAEVGRYGFRTAPPVEPTYGGAGLLPPGASCYTIPLSYSGGITANAVEYSRNRYNGKMVPHAKQTQTYRPRRRPRYGPWRSIGFEPRRGRWVALR